MRTKSLILFLCLPLMALLLACSNDGNSEADEQTAYCDDVNDLKGSFQSLASAVTSLDRSDIDEAIDDVKDDVNNLKSSAQELNSTEGDDVDTAFNSLEQSVEAIGQGGGLSANLQAIENSLKQFEDAVSGAASAYRCQ